ncbi:hypothetical protein KIPB_008000 [Kipferlia bialata]|uniref:Uncharacterized protein n=1 Tax=Kipferlia bialata TaxID=797122 RepID=A0A391NXA8_9EUKA|nr:hypothetical protein KIPB_008000 [Kipferlia bialata]|eukprot:g8000.t1
MGRKLCVVCNAKPVGYRRSKTCGEECAALRNVANMAIISKKSYEKRKGKGKGEVSCPACREKDKKIQSLLAVIRQKDAEIEALRDASLGRDRDMEENTAVIPRCDEPLDEKKSNYEPSAQPADSSVMSQGSAGRRP